MIARPNTLDFAGMLAHERAKRREEKLRLGLKAGQPVTVSQNSAATSSSDKTNEEKEARGPSTAISTRPSKGLFDGFDSLLDSWEPEHRAEGSEWRTRESSCLHAEQESEEATQPIEKLDLPPKPLVRLEGAPPAVLYCDKFLFPDEAAHLEKEIRSHRPGEWITLSKRRLLNLGGVPHPDGMIGEVFPRFLGPVVDRLVASGVFAEHERPNQCLLNAYAPGEGIDPHGDGPLYEATAAVISLGSPALLQFLEPPPPASEQGHLEDRWSWPVVGSVLLRPASLVVFSEDAYVRLVHGVAATEKEVVSETTFNRSMAEANVGDEIPRGPRLSLTLRRVKHVAVPAGEFLQPWQRDEVARRRAWWARAINEKR